MVREDASRSPASLAKPGPSLTSQRERPYDFRTVPTTTPRSERTATLNSLSKSHAMTGWRIGWSIAPPSLAAHLENLALCMLYGLPDFVQDAAVVALESNLPELEAMREAYRQERDSGPS